jgi:hypothetical protein
MCGDQSDTLARPRRVLRLWLFWPSRRRGVAALRSIAWADNVGWVVDLRTTAGDNEHVYAWRARRTSPVAQLVASSPEQRSATSDKLHGNCVIQH